MIFFKVISIIILLLAVFPLFIKSLKENVYITSVILVLIPLIYIILN